MIEEGKKKANKDDRSYIPNDPIQGTKKEGERVFLLWKPYSYIYIHI